MSCNDMRADFVVSMEFFLISDLGLPSVVSVKIIPSRCITDDNNEMTTVLNAYAVVSRTSHEIVMLSGKKLWLSGASLPPLARLSYQASLLFLLRPVSQLVRLLILQLHRFLVPRPPCHQQT